MKYSKTLLLSLLGVVACSFAAAANADSSQPGVERKSSLSKGDQKFLTQAAQSSLAEIETGKFVSQHATRADVKQYAERLVSDHQTSYGELSTLAERKGFALPTSINKEQQSHYNKLISTPSEKLDKTFLKSDMDMHEESIGLHKNAAKDADDNEIRALANKHLTVLQQHKQTSEGLEQALDQKMGQ